MSAIDISNLSKEDKLFLLDELWADMERDPSPLQLSKEQYLELDRRLNTLDKEGPTGLIWEEVFTFLHKQTQSAYSAEQGIS